MAERDDPVKMDLVADISDALILLEKKLGWQEGAEISLKDSDIAFQIASYLYRTGWRKTQ